MQITAKQVNELRQLTGAGLMDCKKALTESSGDIAEAEKILRKKGIASASKKAGREASEGLIHTYIHLGGKVGVMIELNCETDFVAKTDDFKNLAHDIALHIAATGPQFLDRKQVDEATIAREKEIAASQAEGKPAHAIEKIVQGKLDKFFSSVCLLEQPFVKNPDQSIQDLISERISKLGENILLRRYSRFQVGEDG
ncbi:MAG: translation elongation factor Ts [Opitutales bacterium]|nr:translation elongation factor Ts [Opitutales bacterium]